MGIEENEKLTQKWTVASFFDDVPVGFEYPREETPLHATLAGVFAINLTGDDIADVIRQSLNRFSEFTIEGGSNENWDGNLAVTLIKPSGKFDDLYRTVQDTLLYNGAVYNEPQYSGDSFRPHVTKQKSGQLDSGAYEAIKTVSLVDMFPGNNGYRRRIHAVIELANNAT